jgi:uncharacterized protein
MISITLARLLLVAFLFFVTPFLDLREMRRLRAGREPWRRLRFYRGTTALLWILAAICFALMGGHGVFRLDPQVLSGAEWLKHWLFRVPAILLVAGCLGLILSAGAKCLVRERSRHAYAKATLKSALSYMLPIGAQERRWFAAVSITAGICEEVIFRGFLLSVARQELKLGLLVALLLSSVLFGVNHLYQGTAGVLQSTLIGFLLGLVAILTGGLLLPMLLHALIDLQVLLMYRPELAEPVPAADK